jgi:hypothetical protein
MAVNKGTLHNLADIAWFIKGYAAAIGGYDGSEFGEEHAQAMRDAMALVRAHLQSAEPNKQDGRTSDGLP